ncbi:MAG: glutamine amidotransferase, partial [Planctomycetaceae bacterium]
QLAHHYAERAVPIHVFPVGDTARGGDVAIVSVVAPQRVRKFSDVQVQVFLRSFGYGGRRTEVQLVAAGEGGGPDERLAALPITLRGGAQSVTLSYRSDERGRRLSVRVPEQEDELSSRNNSMAAEVAIDRTKIRVLYLEGSDQPLRVVNQGTTYEYVGAHTPLEEALTQDEDIECVSLVEFPGSSGLVRIQSFTSGVGRRGFPETVAELAAFDCVVLSNVSTQTLTEEQIEWLTAWVENRGGGLLMVGGENSFFGGGWAETPLAGVLPVEFASSSFLTAQADVKIDAATGRHAVWEIVADQEQNRKILDAVPAFGAVHQGLEPKPIAEVLAVTTALGPEPQPLLVAGRYGRGRSMALAAPITAPYAEEFIDNWQP